MPDVPTLFELMDKEKTPAHSRLLANVMLDGSGFGPYPIVAAPGVPAERIKILREAYGLTLKTPEFLEEAKKNKWETKPVGGDELDALAKEVAKPSPEVIERLKSLLGDLAGAVLPVRKARRQPAAVWSQRHVRLSMD